MFFVSDYPAWISKVCGNSPIQEVIVKFQNGSLEKAVMHHPIQNTRQIFS